MKDLGLLTLRLTAGGLLAGHGAQKLFGSFEGPGREGTAGWLESIGLKPGKPWAIAAGLSEFGGGLLTALGLAWPLGPIGAISAMAVATGKVHWGKPIWATSGGAELPVTNAAIASSLILTGPGRISLDKLLGTRLSWSLALLAAAGAVGGVALAVTAKPPAKAEGQEPPPAEAPAALADEQAPASMPDEGLSSMEQAPLAASAQR